MKESESKRKETTLHKLLSGHKQSFLQVRSGLGLDEKIGFGACPAAHQGTGEYPFVVLALTPKNDGELKTFISLGYFPEEYDFVDSVLNYHKFNKWSNFQGHVIVSPTSHFVSFWMHPRGFDEPDLKPKLNPLNPVFTKMPKDVFEGGLALSLSKAINPDNYPQILADRLYVDLSIKYLKYMIKTIAESLKKTGIPNVSEIDVENIEHLEEIDKKLAREFPGWKMQSFGDNWQTQLLTRVRNHSNDLHRLMRVRPSGL